MDSPWEAPDDSTTSQAEGAYKSLTLLARVVLVQQGFVLLTGLGLWLTSLILYFGFPHALDAAYIPEAAVEISLFLIIGVIALADVGARLIGLPVWLYWHVAAARNLRALGHRHLDHSPASHAWWWFVPFANLVMPYRATSELVGASIVDEPDDFPAAPDSMPAWWGLWLAGNILSNISLRMSLNPGMEEVGAVAELISTPLSTGATTLYITYVLAVDRGQTRQAAKLA